MLFKRKSQINKTNNFFYIDDLKAIKKSDLENKNILLAIGSRFLNDTANYYLNCKANVFTRVLPTHESITKAFGSCIKNSNIAMLEPSKSNLAIREAFALLDSVVIITNTSIVYLTSIFLNYVIYQIMILIKGVRIIIFNFRPFNQK